MGKGGKALARVMYLVQLQCYVGGESSSTWFTQSLHRQHRASQIEIGTFADPLGTQAEAGLAHNGSRPFLLLFSLSLTRAGLPGSRGT